MQNLKNAQLHDMELSLKASYEGTKENCLVFDNIMLRSQVCLNKMTWALLHGRALIHDPS